MDKKENKSSLMEYIGVRLCIALTFIMLIIIVVTVFIPKNNNNSEIEALTSEHPKETKPPKTNIVYVRDYVGRNASQICSSFVGNICYDKQGDIQIKLVFTTGDGSFINREDLEQYVVKDQNVPHNAENRITYKWDRDNKQMTNIVEAQSYDEIILRVIKIEK